MSKRSQIAYAPYNFVPFPEQIIHRYEHIDDLPTHNVSRDEERHLYSGEITFDITAESPLLVADGDERRKDASEYDFIKNASGKYEIPGSTLRGLLRSNVSILSMSNWANDIDREKFYYRTVGESGTTLANTYRDIVGSGVEEYQGRARNVKAGYLVKTGPDQFVIYPARTDGGRKNKSYYKYHVGNVNKRFKAEFERKLKQGFKVKDCTFAVNRHGRATYLNGRDAPFKGKKVFSGPMFGKRSAYIINELDRNARPIQISSKQLRVFKADYEFKKSKFPQRDREKLEDFFFLPEDQGINNAKPCFYLERGKDLYFGFTAFLRITYDYDTMDMIPKRIQDAPYGIDYEKALFGFVKNDFINYQAKHDVSDYASRVHFFPSEIAEDPQSLIKGNKVLASPRASALQMYLQQDLDKSDYYSYNDEDTQLRGMKHYWIKNVSKEKEFKSNPGIQSKLNLLPEQTVFQAKIKFDQLYEDELGLLLWAIQGPTHHQLGMGKPYGYGVVTFSNVQCKTTSPLEMYDDVHDLFNLGFKQQDPNHLIATYKKFIRETYSIDLKEQKSVQVFFQMKVKSPLQEKQMEYMPLRNGYDQNPKLPTASDLLNGRYK